MRWIWALAFGIIIGIGMVWAFFLFTSFPSGHKEIYDLSPHHKEASHEEEYHELSGVKDSHEEMFTEREVWYGTERVYIGMDESDLVHMWGQPERKDPTAFGYEWWIYRGDDGVYVQVGVNEGRVNTVYSHASGWQWMGIEAGQRKAGWIGEMDLEKEPSLVHESGSVTFLLRDSELREKPLLLYDDVAVQFYIDIHQDERLNGIRLMDIPTLLVHRPFTLQYTGPLPQAPELNEPLKKQIEAAAEQQSFDLVNTYRIWMGMEPFAWHEKLADIARGHSFDMVENDFFSHVSPRYGDLGQRMQSSGLSYLQAGENLAWNYLDAAEAHHGWLNSLGHRQNIVEPDFTHLGVGVISDYYTQNFIRSLEDDESDADN